MKFHLMHCLSKNLWMKRFKHLIIEENIDGNTKAEDSHEMSNMIFSKAKKKKKKKKKILSPVTFLISPDYWPIQ